MKNNRRLPALSRKKQLPTRNEKPRKNQMFFPTMPSIFQPSTVSDKYATRDTRVHCVAVERTAIYRDANGNKVVLKENSTTMNTPESFRGAVFHHRGNRWVKK